jgi:hypothetical protein
MSANAVVHVRLREALLAAGLFVLLGGLLALVGCSAEQVAGHLTCQLYDQAVACDSLGCVAPDGGTAAEIPVAATQVVISTEASKFQPDGVYVYAELAAPAETLGVLELDVPRHGAGQATVAYGEWRGAEQVFRATRTAGTVVLAPPGDQRGRFLLRVDDSGADGALGTADDQTRVLAAGEFGGMTATVPLPGEPLTTPPAPGDDDGAVIIDVIDLVIDGVTSPPVDDPGDDTSGEDSGGGCGGEDTSGSDSSGCDSGDAAGDSSGCEGDAGGSGCDGADVGGSGCDGSGSTDDAAGCGSSDSSSDSWGCEGDYARSGAKRSGLTSAPAGRPHARGPQRLAPLVLLGAFGLWCRGGRRRR